MIVIKFKDTSKVNLRGNYDRDNEVLIESKINTPSHSSHEFRHETSNQDFIRNEKKILFSTNFNSIITGIFAYSYSFF